MNTLDFSKLKVGSYNRKSSEDEDKQVLSIESQTDEALRIREYYKLNTFVETFRESKSAKTEGVRPEFARMMSMIHKGQIDAVVCWKADRLARNMTEGGQIIDLLSSGKLKAILTHDKVFYPWDNVIVLSVEFSQGKQFVKELSINVKRGQEKKARMGIPHGAASLGFLNDKTEDKGNRNWKVDKIKLESIKILLQIFLTGRYSAGKLYEYAIKELKLSTVIRKKIGGKLISPSRIYELLTDPIYAGFFYQGGVRYELNKNLPRLITEEQHNKIKIILQRRNIPKVQKHKVLYSGFMASAENNFMGQDVKYQLICDCKKKFAYRAKTHCPNCGKEIAQLSNPKYLNYIFYYDVKKKKLGEEYRSISEKKVNDEFISYLENLNFSKELADWSKEYIVELKNKEINEVIFESERVEADRMEFNKKKARLREMLRDGQITDGEYQSDLGTLTVRYENIEKKAPQADWFKEMNEIVDLTRCAAEIAQSDDFEEKRNLLTKLGSNLVWNEEKLNVYSRKSIEKLVEGIKRTKQINSKFEPSNYFTGKGVIEKTEPNDPVFSNLLGR
jgi:DNA invertase Pin-like site-specific DNA recombinase